MHKLAKTREGCLKAAFAAGAVILSTKMQNIFPPKTRQCRCTLGANGTNSIHFYKQLLINNLFENISVIMPNFYEMGRILSVKEHFCILLFETIGFGS